MNRSVLVSAAIAVAGIVLLVLSFGGDGREPAVTSAEPSVADPAPAADATPPAAAAVAAVAVGDPAAGSAPGADRSAPVSPAPAAASPAHTASLTPAAPPPSAPQDADGDGVADTADTCRNTAPGVAVDARGCAQRLQDVLLYRPAVAFASSSATVDTASALQELDSVLAVLRRYPESQARVLAYTDSSGRADMNQRLSEQRAAAVAAVLTEAGIEAPRVTHEGRGDADPIASNDTPAGRALNRRIEVLVEPGDPL